MRASTLRNDVAKTMISWEGGREGGQIHKAILKTWNDYAKGHGLAQAYGGYAWCDITASSAWIKNKMAKYVPISMSCGQSITLAKKMGIWVENDKFVPSVGDGIIYDWEDTSGTSKDNTSGHDHIGIVISVASNKKSFVVIEGNKGYPSQVGRRTVSVNWRYIRGFIHPDYIAAAKEITKQEKAEAKKDTSTQKEPITSTPAKPAPTPAPTKEITATSYAQKFSSSIAGTYKIIAKDGLNMRNGAGTKYKIMTTIKYNTKVKCYGYYSLSGLTKWYFVTFTTNGVTYNGFVHSGYLERA